MDKPVVRISVRNLVEFILRSGDLDNRGGSSDREAMQKGSRLHRKIQGRMGSHYRAEVSLKYKTEYEDVSIQVEGRADGIFTEDGQCWIDEIKGVYADVSQLEKPVEVHRAQAMCYAWIYAQEQKAEKIGVQMTYGPLCPDSHMSSALRSSPVFAPVRRSRHNTLPVHGEPPQAFPTD